MRGTRLMYDRWLQSSPLLTKGVTSAILFGLGDQIAQRIDKFDENERDGCEAYNCYGLQRTAKMMVWGGFVFAPVGHVWYNFLEKAVRGTGMTAVAKKVAADQVVFSPPLSLAFFTYSGVSETLSLRNAVDTAATKLAPTLAVNWTVWPLVHVCTFGFVPLQYRILFINVVNIGWSAFLSRMATQEDGRVSTAQKFEDYLIQQMEETEETTIVS